MTAHRRSPSLCGAALSSSRVARVKGAMSELPPSRGRRRILGAALGAVFPACRARPRDPGPSIEFTRIPMADAGGSEKNDIIEGIVKDGRPGQKIVLYAKSGKWWIQPLV